MSRIIYLSHSCAVSGAQEVYNTPPRTARSCVYAREQTAKRDEANLSGQTIESECDNLARNEPKASHEALRARDVRVYLPNGRRSRDPNGEHSRVRSEARTRRTRIESGGRRMMIREILGPYTTHAASHAPKDACVHAVIVNLNTACIAGHFVWRLQ